MDFRKLHRKIAPILFLPLLLSATTGIAYRIGKTWFGLSNDVVEYLLVVHQGEYLGRPLVPVYVLLSGLGLLGLVITGLSMLRIKRQLQHHSKWNLHWVHHCIATIVFLPLAVSAMTGVVFRLGKAWFNFPSEWAILLLNLHQGTYLGSQLRVFYILWVGLGLIILLITGMQMTGIFRTKKTIS